MSKKYNVADQVYIVDGKDIFLCFVSHHYLIGNRYLVGLSEKIDPDGTPRESVNCYKYPRGFRKVNSKNLYSTLEDAKEKLRIKNEILCN